MKRKRRLTIVALLLAVSSFFPFTYTMDSEGYSLRAVSGYQFLGEHLFLVLVLVVAYLLGL